MKKIVLLRHGESICNKENPAHGNSLRGIIKYLKNIPDDEIIHLNLPTAVPYIFEFDDNLNFVKDYFLDDPEKIKKLMDAVAHQGKKSK